MEHLIPHWGGASVASLVADLALAALVLAAQTVSARRRR